MNYNQRINFYLGKDLSKNNFDINNFISKKSIKDLYSDNIFIEKYYNDPLKKLLFKTKNINKYFDFTPGDISHINNIFVLCKNRLEGNDNSVILKCLNFDRHWLNYYEKPVDNIPFENKLSKVFWRGTTTGTLERRGNRFDLVKKWFNKNNDIDIGFSNICQNQNEYEKYLKEQCSINIFLQYKYIISVEGNDKDSGLNWKLNSDCLVMMAKPGITSWLMETILIPNYHYILLEDDFSDLEEKLYWCNNNQDICIDIIKNANNFMKQFQNYDIENKLEEDLINKYIKLVNQ
jgi:hypothetical protein